MKMALKYTIPIQSEPITLPAAAWGDVLLVGTHPGQDNAVQVWIEAHGSSGGGEASCPRSSRTFKVFGTGEPIERDGYTSEDFIHRGSTMKEPNVWHLYELVKSGSRS